MSGAGAADGGPADGTSDDDRVDFDRLVDRMAAEQARAPQEDTPLPGAGDGDERVDPPPRAGEAETLEGFLDYLRATILHKSAGLDDEQGARRLLGSERTVTGLLRHLADVERYWFREVVGGLPEDEVGYRWFAEDDHEAEWHVGPADSVQEAREDYAAACASSRAQTAGRDLGDLAHRTRDAVSVRWVLAHMIEETGRHAGHLDVLTELLDGRTGE